MSRKTIKVPHTFSSYFDSYFSLFSAAQRFYSKLNKKSHLVIERMQFLSL